MVSRVREPKDRLKICLPLPNMECSPVGSEDLVLVFIVFV